MYTQASAVVPFGKVIVQRELYRRTGSEGPHHDPYGYEECTVTLNGVEHTLHTGLGVWYKVNGVTVRPQAPYGEREEWLIAEWEFAVGMTQCQFEKAYWRVHPYYEDPMGHPSQYI